MIIACIFFISFLLSVTGFIKRIKLRKQLRELEQTGKIAKVLNDYAYARSMYGGKLMMGNFYAFGKGCNAVVEYADIDRMYEYVHYTNSIRDQRMFRVSMKNGETFELCHLRVFRKKFEEEMQIVRILSERNPSVQIETEVQE